MLPLLDTLSRRRRLARCLSERPLRIHRFPPRRLRQLSPGDDRHAWPTRPAVLRAL
jgi:hypothetical protein